jgi:zinc transporter 2
MCVFLDLFRTDAAHLLSDVAAFMISLFAVLLGERPPTSTHTFGYHRIEVIGALVSVLLIWLLTGILVYEAILRIITPEVWRPAFND